MYVFSESGILDNKFKSVFSSVLISFDLTTNQPSTKIPNANTTKKTIGACN